MIAPLRALVVEDEPPSRDRLCALLAAHPDALTVVAAVGDVAAARDALARHRPDVVFLDVELPGGSGLALLDGLAAGTHVVFVTAYAGYALRAFEANAADYLLKPVAPDRLATTVARLRTRGPALAAEALAALAHALRPAPPAPVSLPVRRGDGVVFVPFDRITWIEARDKVLFAHTLDGGAHLLDGTLTGLLGRLPEGFVQVHRAAVVNRRPLRAATRPVGGRCVLALEGGARVTTGPTYADAVDALVRL